MYNKNLSELMDKINYQFKDINLLKNALTHSLMLMRRRLRSIRIMKDLSSLVMQFWNLHQAITFIRITAI